MSDFSRKLVEATLDEFSEYEGYFENQSPLKERIGQYWTFLEKPGRDGSSPYAWSAAFISYMVNAAGAEDAFRYSGQHSVYFYRHIRDRLNGEPKRFWAYRPYEIEIEPGDILGMNRSADPAITYDMAAGDFDYDSHADIVVAVEVGTFHTVGGNVGEAPGQVGRKRFARAGGKLVNSAKPAQEVFAVIRSFLP